MYSYCFIVMIPGLKKGQFKMSKSDPDSAIFMEDTEKEIARKVKGAYCPPGSLEENSVIEWCRYFVWMKYKTFRLERSEQNGGVVVYDCFDKLCEDYVAEKIHPGDLKATLFKYLNDIIKPVRDHFQNDPNARDLLSKVVLW
jgi:tyrosyl-tRNA synthetase